MQVRADCVAPCMPRWPQAGPAHPCQPPYLWAEPFCLSRAEIGTLLEVPQACYRMIYPRTRTHCHPLWTLQGPAPVLASQALLGDKCGQLASPTQLLTQGVLPVPCQQANQCTPGRTGRGPAAAIPNSTGCAQQAAHGLTVWSPSSALRRSALRMGQFSVHPALSLAREGDYYRVRIATG